MSSIMDHGVKNGKNSIHSLSLLKDVPDYRENSFGNNFNELLGRYCRNGTRSIIVNIS